MLGEHRGTAKLSGGEAVVELPEYFSKLTEKRGLTVQLTPVGGWSRLYVAERSPQRLVVRQSEGDDAVEWTATPSTSVSRRSAAANLRADGAEGTAPRRRLCDAEAAPCRDSSRVGTQPAY